MFGPGRGITPALQVTHEGPLSLIKGCSHQSMVHRKSDVQSSHRITSRLSPSGCEAAVEKAAARFQLVPIFFLLLVTVRQRENGKRLFLNDVG